MKSSGSPSTLLFALQNCNIRLRTCWRSGWRASRGPVSNTFLVMLSDAVAVLGTQEPEKEQPDGALDHRNSVSHLRSSSAQRTSAATLCWQFSLGCELAATVPVSVGFWPWRSGTGKQKCYFHTGFLLLHLLADAKRLGLVWESSVWILRSSSIS